MRTIPLTLKERIAKANQSLYENADPKMDILIRRARSGLTAQDLFYVTTIREEPELQDLEMLGIALERSDEEKGPHKAWNIYIQNGICKVATKGIPAKAKEQWVDILTIGPAAECDITFDGRWVRDKKQRWNLITIGPPWIFWTTPAGQLYCRHWTAGEPTLLASGVGKIAALRGWKSVANRTMDQGIVAAYLGSGGQLYYRNYSEQLNESFVWESERTLVISPDPICDIGLFRTNDFRLGFVVETVNGQIYMGMTERAWAAFGIDEKLSVRMSDLVITRIPVTYSHIETTERLSVKMTSLKTSLCKYIEVSPISFANPDKSETIIEVKFNYPLFSHAGFQAEITVKDSANTNYPVLSTEQGETPDILVLHCSNFSGHNTNLTVSYANVDGSLGSYSGDCFFGALFSSVFVPDLTPPAGHNFETLKVKMTALQITRHDITTTHSNHTETLKVKMTALQINRIHISNIEA